MCCPDQGAAPAVKTAIPKDDGVGKRTTKLWAHWKETKAESWTLTWCTDRSRTDEGKVGAAAVCLHGCSWMVFGSYLRTGWNEVVDAPLWAIWVRLRMTVAIVEMLWTHSVMTVAALSDLQAPIRQTAHLDREPGHRCATAFNKHGKAFCANGIEAVIHWVLGHSGTPWIKKGYF